MKKRVSIILLTIIASLVPLVWFVSAQGTVQPLGSSSSDGARSVRINLGAEPPTLDPALAEDRASITVIEQLFAGLVDVDDETGEVIPELASGWEVSGDASVYTFTLRGDATWSDGAPITAQDVRYGILRSLQGPNYYAGILASSIENAQAYRDGTIADPDLVGVTALDSTHLRVTMNGPAAYGLSILALWVARPMPQWAIETHGVPTWTEAANIVTSGPYRLSEWDHGVRITMDKNPGYVAAANVQIEQVQMAMVDTNTAWQMYLDGELDTALVPLGASPDTIVAQEVHLNSDSAVFYNGYSASQPPFDDPLVRRAFAAATRRSTIVNQRPEGHAIAAQTFTAPGIFGHVDGAAEGVGLPYDPDQARQWLAEAGYPGGAGLPPITYWHYAGEAPAAQASLLRDGWYETLGVSVTLQSLPFSELLSQCANGNCQVWTLGWGADYADAYNYVHDALTARGRFGNWTNPTYENLLAQARAEPDPAARAQLYKQTEEILVETDSVLTPLYYRATPMASKPYLERTYPSFGSFDIAGWRMTWVSATIDAGGGSLTSLDGTTTAAFPTGAFTDTTVLTYTPASAMPPGGELAGVGQVFDLTATYSTTGQPAQPAAGTTFTLTIQYDEAQLAPTVNENTLALYYWNGDEWVLESTSTVDVDQNTVTAAPDHLSLWGVFGEEKRLFLPGIMKGN